MDDIGYIQQGREETAGRAPRLAERDERRSMLEHPAATTRDGGRGAEASETPAKETAA